MAISNTLTRSCNYASQVLRNIPTSGINNIVNEPALTIGDWVRQFIVSAPFKWRWNRAVTQVSLVSGLQTVVSNLTNFGWAEKAVIDDGSGNFHELKIETVLPQEGVADQPKWLSVFSEDLLAQSVVFSVFPVPDGNYTMTVTYQKAAPSFSALGDTWAPIPDYFSYLYNQGIVAKFMEYKDDPRAPAAMQLFVQQLLAVAEGLDESQKNIFMSEYINTARQTQRLKT